MIEHLSSLHAKIHDPGQRSFEDYCARVDARLEFCERVIAAWPRIAAVLEASASCIGSIEATYTVSGGLVGRQPEVFAKFDMLGSLKKALAELDEEKK